MKTLFFLAFFAIISSVGFFEVAFAQTSENQGATITIDPGVAITLDGGTFNNMGPFNNNGILTISATTTFNNSDDFVNTGTVNILGTFNLLCGGTVTGTGTFTGNPIVDMCNEDTTPPTITPPADVTVDATSSSGAVVNYPAATATDDVGVTVGPTCTPASGSTFSIGSTTVTCTAEDAAGNVGSATFTVTVNEIVPNIALPPYTTNLITIYNSRPDLQSQFPEVNNGDLSQLFIWASDTGVTEYLDELLKYDHVYNLMKVYNGLPGVQAVYPEAANGVDLSGLFKWASQYAVGAFQDPLGPHEAVYDLMRVYNWLPGVQGLYPEAANGVDLSGLFTWASQYGAGAFQDPLGPHQAVYDLMRVYSWLPSLQAGYPEAANGADIKRLVCWADWYVNLGPNGYPILAPHAAFYASKC